MVPKAEFPSFEVTDHEPEPQGSREVWFDGKAHDTAVYDRTRFRAGAALTGPAIIDQVDSTTVVPPGATATVDKYMNILIRVGG